MSNALWAKMHGGTTHFPIALVMASMVFDLAGFLLPDNPGKTRRSAFRQPDSIRLSGSTRCGRGNCFRASNESGTTLGSREPCASSSLSLAGVRSIDRFGRLASRSAGSYLSTRIQIISGRLNAHSGPDGCCRILGWRAVAERLSRIPPVRFRHFDL